MLNLSTKIKIDEDTVKSKNLAERFTAEDLTAIGMEVHENYLRDLQSRETWYRRTEAAMDLALQIQTTKTFPWPNCSNIKFPLVTIAALQFHSRAYPSIVNGRKVVDCQVIGPDPDGGQGKRADRISTHMSWQLLEQDESWEEEQDRLLINLPIVGVCFKKSYYNASLGHNVSELVMAKDFVIDYWAKSVEGASVKTHIIPMYRNKIHENVKRGTFCDVLEEAWFQADAPRYNLPNQDRRDKRDGLAESQSNQNTPFTVLEQHCNLDLDDDGYYEPYIVTIEESTQTVLRIVTRFDRIEDVEYTDSKKKQIIKITPMEYFTKVPFIPNPDGSIMDIGFGTLLGPLNESVDSAINQLFDAGTMANTAGGFLGRGAKIRGGLYQFNPFEWNRVDSTGDDLRKSVFPLPIREPSAVLFQLLGFLVEYTNRISGSTDILAGENPGQNTPAETSRNLTDQGLKVYSAIFKRVWRSMKQEFKKLYTLNAIYLPENFRFGASGDEIAREDYAAGATMVVPVADPTITSDGARFAQARLVREAAASAAGYDGDAVERMYLRALQVSDIDNIFPGSDAMGPAPIPERIQIAQIKAQVDAAKLEFAKMQFMLTQQATVQLNNAKIQELTAKTFKLYEEGKAEPEKQRINAFNASIQAMREENNQINNQMQTMLEAMSNGQTAATNTGGTGILSLEGPSGNSTTDALGFPEEEGIDGSVGVGGTSSNI